MTVRNKFEVLSLGDEAQESRESEFGEKESRDTLQDGACFESVFPYAQNKALKTKLARKEDSPPRGKFTNRCKQSLVHKETISVNGWEEGLDQPVAQHPVAFLVTWSRQTRVFIRCTTWEGIVGNLFRVLWILEQSTVWRLLTCLPFQIADISRPLTSAGELADAGNVVAFGRKGGYVLNVGSGRRLDFKREHGCTCFALGSRSERSWVLVG